MTSVGNAMASALVAEGKTGVERLARYDLWAPARQYMVYHGQPRILTEIASVNLADPFINPAGPDVPLGPQEVRWNYPVPYRQGEWRLRQIVDYAQHGRACRDFARCQDTGRPGSRTSTRCTRIG